MRYYGILLSNINKPCNDFSLTAQASLYRRGSGTGCNPVVIDSGGSTPSRRTLEDKRMVSRHIGNVLPVYVGCEFESRVFRAVPMNLNRMGAQTVGLQESTTVTWKYKPIGGGRMFEPC